MGNTDLLTKINTPNSQPTGNNPDVSNPPQANTQPPPKNTHSLTVPMLAIAFVLFLIGSFWFLFVSSPKTTQTVSQTPSPTSITSQTSSASSPSPAETNPLKPSVDTDLDYLSKELSSGDPKRIAAVSGIDPTTLSASVAAQFEKLKTIEFDKKTFQTTDNKHASILATIIYKDGSEFSNQSIFLNFKNGRWLFGKGN